MSKGRGIRCLGEGGGTAFRSYQHERFSDYLRRGDRIYFSPGYSTEGGAGFKRGGERSVQDESRLVKGISNEIQKRGGEESFAPGKRGRV